MSERPDNLNSRHIQAEVSSRLHAKGDRSTVHLAGAECCRYTLNTIVWETLAVLGEWELIELGDLE